MMISAGVSPFINLKFTRAINRVSATVTSVGLSGSTVGITTTSFEPTMVSGVANGNDPGSVCGVTIFFNCCWVVTLLRSVVMPLRSFATT